MMVRSLLFRLVKWSNAGEIEGKSNHFEDLAYAYRVMRVALKAKSINKPSCQKTALERKTSQQGRPKRNQ